MAQDPEVEALMVKLGELKSRRAQIIKKEFDVAFDREEVLRRNLEVANRPLDATVNPEQAKAQVKAQEDARRFVEQAPELSKAHTLDVLQNISASLEHVFQQADPAAFNKMTKEEFDKLPESVRREVSDNTIIVEDVTDITPRVNPQQLERLIGEAKYLMGPEHLQDFLVQRYGEDNVQRRGNIVAYREDENSEPRVFKMPGFQAEDALAAGVILTRDAPGMILESLAISSGAGAFAALLAGGLGDVGGALATETPVGENVAAGAAGSVGGRLLRTGAASVPLTDKSFVRHIAREQFDRDVLRQAKAAGVSGTHEKALKNLKLAQENPNLLNVAEIAETRRAHRFYNFVADNPDLVTNIRFRQSELVGKGEPSALLRNLSTRQVDSLVGAMTKLDDNVNQALRAYEVAQRPEIQASIQGRVFRANNEALSELTRGISEKYTGFMAKAHEAAGGAPVIDAREAIRTFQARAKKYLNPRERSPLQGTSTGEGLQFVFPETAPKLKGNKAVRSQMGEMQKIVQRSKNGFMTAKDFAEFVKRARMWSVGKAPVSETATKKLQVDGIEINDAITQVMAKASRGGGQAGEAVGFIQQANEAWKFGLRQKKKHRQTWLGVLAEADAKGVVLDPKRFWKAPPSEITTGLRYIQNFAPELVEPIRGGAIDNMIQRFGKGAASGIEAPPFTAKQASDFLGEHIDRLKALYADSPGTQQKLEAIQSVAKLKAAAHGAGNPADISSGNIVDWLVVRPVKSAVRGVSNALTFKWGELRKIPRSLQDASAQFAFIIRSDRVAKILQSERGIDLLHDVVTGADAARMAIQGNVGGRAASSFLDWNASMAELLDMVATDEEKQQ